RSDRITRQNLTQRGRDSWRREVFRVHDTRDVQPQEPRGVVRLIESHRHHELRDTCRERLSGRSDAAMMDDGGCLWTQPGERGVWHVTDVRRQRRRQVFKVRRDEQRSPSDGGGCLDSGLKERRRVAVGGAGCENYRWGAIAEESIQTGGLIAVR